MSGHSKWSTIKRKKGAADAKRSKVFTRILKEINISVKEGGPDPEGNPRLRLAISNAKGANMPKENIQRAISKASGKEAENYIETTYEGYSSNGIAVFVECTTDNIKRTVADVRHCFTKTGGSLGTNGSLAFLFERKGVFTGSAKGIDEESFTLEVIEEGAEDLIFEEGIFTVYTSMENFGAMQKKLEEMNVEVENAELQRIPKNTTVLETEAAKSVLKLIDMLEDLDDVQNVYHNLELTEELMDVI